MTRRSASRLVPVLLVVFLLAVGCGGAGSSGESGNKITADQFKLSGTQRDAQFTVGSESFTEQKILGAIAVRALEAAGATVTDRTGEGGNAAVREALLAGEIDLYWEYTATGWLVHLSETRVISDPRKQYEAVAKKDLEDNDIEWIEPAPGDDTYAIAVSEKTRKDLGVETISDMKRLVQERPDEATLCLNNDDDFRSRFDGLPGLQRAYDFEFEEKNLAEVSLDAVYGAVEDGEICNFGVVFTTSGLLQDSNLELLDDDEDFFAVYNPSLTIQKNALEQYPQLPKLFAPISQKLDTKTLRDLNYQVDVEGKSPDRVAERWLRENDFIE